MTGGETLPQAEEHYDSPMHSQRRARPLRGEQAQGLYLVLGVDRQGKDGRVSSRVSTSCPKEDQQ